MYSQYSSTSNDGQGTAQSKNIKRNELQREIVMQEADLRKKAVEKLSLESEIREMKKDEQRIKVDMQKKQTDFQRIEQDVLQMEMSIKDLKKKLNLIN